MVVATGRVTFVSLSAPRSSHSGPNWDTDSAGPTSPNLSQARRAILKTARTGRNVEWVLDRSAGGTGPDNALHSSAVTEGFGNSPENPIGPNQAYSGDILSNLQREWETRPHGHDYARMRNYGGYVSG